MNETIAALSTAPGPSMRAVVRLSGPEAFACASSLLAGGSDLEGMKGFSAPEVKLSLSGAELPVRMIVMRAPRSYTTEDVVEFHILGAHALAERILSLCLDQGARLARPGEFTQRAYLGGRIDASQVEGVLQVIESRSDEERSAAVHLLEGKTLRAAGEVRNILVHVLAGIEAYLDFTDEDTEALDVGTLREELVACSEHLQQIEHTLNRKKPLGNLPRLVLLGPPNAGKSSLFRALVPASRSLTSEVPGTTRDLLEGEVKKTARPFLLYDAPGVAESRDPLERLALSRLAGMTARMDGLIIVLDRAAAPQRQRIARLMAMAGCKPFLVVMNKSDLPEHGGWKEYNFNYPTLTLSALKGRGMENLIETLDPLIDSLIPGGGGVGVDFQLASTTRRAQQAIQEALEEDWEGGLELVAMELREATEAIGQLTGRVWDEEILNELFSRFCIGK
ncbi:MAG: tRNA modification GTPase [Planctomycetota bacterium]|jgi:tRNA modification GTPase